MKTNQELEAEIDRLGQALQQQRVYAEGFVQIVGVLAVYCPAWKGRGPNKVHEAVAAVEELARASSRSGHTSPSEVSGD